MNLLRSISLTSASKLSRHFMPHQLAWIQAEKAIHDKRKQAVALAEKSVRIGWTYADAFKNVRKRILFSNRDYLFATKDYPSALEYVRQCYQFAQVFNLTRSVISHGEELLAVNKLDEHGRPSAFTEDVRVGVIKFDTGSRIIAFSANPQAMSVYGGDVGLDEFAKHPNARLLWETAQARVTWNYDIAIWSSHDGEDTVFNEFAQEARAGKGPWNIYYRVTLPDAIGFGLVDTINRARGTRITAEQFLADCRGRARDEEIFEQSYMCNPLGAVANHITEWSAIERCRMDYQIERVHLEAADVLKHFGEFSPSREPEREYQIGAFLRENLPLLLAPKSSSSSSSSSKSPFTKSTKFRLGFDVAASGQGDLAAIYIDEAKGDELWLRALFTCRTEDWHFLKTVLFYFLQHLPNLQAAGDESGLGRQICWEASSKYSSRFMKVNFTSKKHDLGFALMNQLSVAEKRFPRAQADIASDYFALRKTHNGTKWAFSEGKNALNQASHCDIAWAGALATHAHTERKCTVGCAVLMEDGTIWSSDDPPGTHGRPISEAERERRLMMSDDPRIWQPLRW
jgi:phage FluMu gp28-like protein